MKRVHLILKHKWFDEIEKGIKTIEYRRNSDYWFKRIIGKNKDGSDQAKFVVFHRGYSKQTMTFSIDYIVLSTCIEIHLGARI